MVRIIDTHSHLYSDKFHHDHDAVIDRARDVLQAVLLPNIDARSIQAMHELGGFAQIAHRHQHAGQHQFLDRIGIGARGVEDDNAELAIRGYEPRQAWVEIHRGLFSTSTRELLAPPEPHFVGRIDKAIINTPAEGQSGTIELTCSDDLREMTRTNPARKSHEQQKRRSVDLFRQYNTTAAEWQIYWGEAKPSRSQDPGPDGTRPGADG